jgi:hypothetical protein
MHPSHDKPADRRAFLGKTSALALGTLGGLLGVGSASAQDKSARTLVSAAG